MHLRYDRVKPLCDALSTVNLQLTRNKGMNAKLGDEINQKKHVV